MPMIEDSHAVCYDQKMGYWRSCASSIIPGANPINSPGKEISEDADAVRPMCCILTPLLTAKLASAAIDGLYKNGLWRCFVFATLSQLRLGGRMDKPQTFVCLYR